MSSPELVSAVWKALLALTVGIGVVLTLRSICRRWLGAERAYHLWWLPWLAVVASQLPHAVSAATNGLPAVVVTITSATSHWSAPVAAESAWTWRAFLPIFWLMGTVLLLMRMVVSQRRYRRQLTGATPISDASVRAKVLCAPRDDIGPALVGLWRPSIVVPRDFDCRYDVRERALILAHEAVHASRRDVWWSLFAQFTAMLCWFHPLVWLALRAFHLDQELACDAAVLRMHAGEHRAYARAMLKTQATSMSLPMGCSWSVRHPMTERIAMLKQLPPGRTRRAMGRLMLLVFALVLTGGVYAATAKDGVTFQPSKATVDDAYRAWERARDAYIAYLGRAGDKGRANNATLGLPAADSGQFGKSVKRLDVMAGGGFALTLVDANGDNAGHLDFFVFPVTDATASYPWKCTSADIPGIQSLRPECRYAPEPSVADQVSAAKRGHGLKIVLGVNGRPARLHATTCLRDGRYYETVQGGIDPLPPWDVKLSVVEAAEGQLEVKAEIGGGTLDKTVHPSIRMAPGQTGTIQLGEKIMGKNGQPDDRTLKMDLTPSVGC